MQQIPQISLLKVVSFSAILPLVLPAGIPVNHRHQILTSPVLSHWGEWGKLEHCPSDQIVVGMRLKVHENQGVKDDTGMNAIKFYCKNPYSSTEYSNDVTAITSLVGSAGEWKQDFFCPSTGEGENKSVAVGFQLRSETSSGVKDDTAGNNLKLICSDLHQKQGFTVLEGDGTSRGEWTKQQVCWPGYAICGLQTQVEVSRSMDTTGLNNLKVRCCKADIDSSGNNGNGTFHTEVVSGESGSVQVQESSSSSIEHVEGKDSNQTIDVSNYHPYDYSGESLEGGWDENVDDPNENGEQELAALDPKPVDVGLNESPVSQPSIETDQSAQNTNALGSNEDDNLTDEIARIDQADNSEAVEEERTAVTTDSQKIPDDVVNALADADFADSRNEDDEQRFHQRNGEASRGLQEDDSSSFSDLDTSDASDGADFDEKPTSSRRFGQVGGARNNTSVTAADASASTASLLSSHLSSFRTLGIGSMILLYFFKIVEV